MVRNVRIHLVWLALLLVLGGCTGTGEPRNRIQYYTLEYPSPTFKGLKPLSQTLKVVRFTVAPVYNTTRIIYQDRSFRRDEYFYYRWRSNPADLVTYFLCRDLRQSGLFKAVLFEESEIPFSHLLEGSVDEFLEQDGAHNWNAVLGITVTLMVAREPDVSKMVLFQKSYRVSRVCVKKNPGALARAMSLAMEEISRKITLEIYSLLKDRA